MSDRIGQRAPTAPAVFVELSGIHDLLEKSRTLPVRIQKNVLRKGVRAGTAILVKEARRRVPRRTKRLKRSLATKVKTDRRGVFGLVGQDTRKAAKRSDPSDASRGDKAASIHLAENDTAPHEIRGKDPRESTELGVINRTKAIGFSYGGTKTYRWKVSHPGSRGSHFLREAQQAKAFESQRAVEDKLLREIEIEAEKQANAQVDGKTEEFLSGE